MQTGKYKAMLCNAFERNPEAGKKQMLNSNKSSGKQLKQPGTLNHTKKKKKKQQKN